MAMMARPQTRTHAMIHSAYDQSDVSPPLKLTKINSPASSSLFVPRKASSTAKYVPREGIFTAMGMAYPISVDEYGHDQTKRPRLRLFPIQRLAVAHCAINFSSSTNLATTSKIPTGSGPILEQAWFLWTLDTTGTRLRSHFDACRECQLYGSSQRCRQPPAAKTNQTHTLAAIRRGPLLIVPT